MECNNDCAIRLSKLERRQKGSSRGILVHLPERTLQFAMHDLDGDSMGWRERCVTFTNCRIYPSRFNVYLRF